MKTKNLFFAFTLVVIFLVGCKKEKEVESLTPEVKTNEATVTSGSVTLSGNVVNENGAAVVTRGFCWSRNPNPELNDSVETAGMGPGEFTNTIGVFTKAETYYFRAFATNAIGTSFGEERSFTSQALPPGDPSISLKQGGAYVSTNTEIIVGNTFLVGINGMKNQFSDNNLSRFKFTVVSYLIPTVFIDSVINTPTFSWESELTFTGIGEAELRFELWDEAGNKVLKNLFITVKEEPGSSVTKFTGIQLGSFNNATGGFFATSTGDVYTPGQLVNSPADQAKIDFLFFKGATNANAIASPDDVSANTILAFQLTAWTERNQTRFNKTNMTVAQFDAIGDKFEFPQFNSSMQTTLANNLSEGEIILFKTEEGKLGLIKIVDLYSRGDVAVIDVVVEE